MRKELENLRKKITECELICDLARDRDLSEEQAKVARHYAKLARHFKQRADDLEKEIAELK